MFRRWDALAHAARDVFYQLFDFSPLTIDKRFRLLDSLFSTGSCFMYWPSLFFFLFLTLMLLQNMNSHRENMQTSFRKTQSDFQSEFGAQDLLAMKTATVPKQLMWFMRCFYARHLQSLSATPRKILSMMIIYDVCGVTLMWEPFISER